MVPSKRQKNKKIKSKILPQKTKTVRSEEQYPGSDQLTICWHLGEFDWPGPWGEGACQNLDFRQFLNRTISKWEQMTWAELYSGSGGRRQGNNNHPADRSKLSSRAKKRLRSIKLDDLESLVPLRIDSTTRFYGIRDGRSFQFLWYDPWHDIKNKAVFPSRR